MKARIPNEGYTFNPMNSLGRNIPCPCRSGKKFKQCCMKNVPRFVTHESAPGWKKLKEDAERGDARW